ncbi:MAG: N-acetylmuramoyl-L-alanine amidase-like domain-containing protein [Thermodesulfobacteriota bacterium]
MKINYKATTLALIFSLLVPFYAYSQRNVEIIELGRWNENRLSQMVSQKPDTTQSQVDYISGRFLGTPYKASTLTGDINTPEIFTINLRGMDCFTYLDYVEALRLSNNYDEFTPNVKDIRYRDGKVSFQNRNHFFSDWPIENKENIIDVTYQVAGGSAVGVEKSLNLKEDGSTFLPGIAISKRELYYIPSSKVDEQVIAKLRTGDYVGMYTDIDGLDVTHTGIIIKKDDGIYLRHASSKKSSHKVVDEDFVEYIENVPGIIVYRPK